MTRLLLVVLLLLVAAGGLFYFLGSPDTSDVVSTLPVQTKKQPIAIPETPKPAPAPAAPAKPAAQQEVAAVPVKPADSPAKAETPAPPQAESAQPVAKAETAAKAEAVAPAPFVPVVPTAPSTETAVPMGDYVVNAGAFMLASSLKEAEASIAKLGLPVQLETASKMMPMTRLQLGVYPKDEAGRKLAELLPVAAGAFMLPVDGGYGVFAGSYSSLDKARRFADLLYEKGISVSEVQVEVPVPLTQVKVGPFITQAAAETAVKQLQAAGLEGQVVRIKQAP